MPRFGIAQGPGRRASRSGGPRGSPPSGRSGPGRGTGPRGSRRRRSSAAPGLALLDRANLTELVLGCVEAKFNFFEILQENMHWKALAEIYTMHSFAPFFNIKIFSQKSSTFFRD